MVDLERAGEIVASSQGYKIYAAGGIVRDLLLGMDCSDIDLVVEGDGIELPENWVKKTGRQGQVHPKFITATCCLFSKRPAGGCGHGQVEFYQ
jgi:tRNA nucleotidyltransferase (CCA-adding enzyme)